MKALFEKVLKSADGGELFKREQQLNSVTMQLGEVQKINGKKTLDIALRLINDNNMGSAVSTSVNDETIVERAMLSCKYQKQKPVKFINGTPSEVLCFDKKVASMSVDDMVSECERILTLFKTHDTKIIPEINIDKAYENIHIMNSAQFDNKYDKTTYSIAVSTKTPKGFLEVWDMIESSRYKEFAEKDIVNLIHKHHISQNRVAIETDKMPVIFSGRAMGSLMLRFIAGIKCSNVFKGLSPLEGKISQRVFSDAITILDNGKLDWGTGTCPFDDEGVVTSDTLLIKNGILEGYLMGIADAEKLNLNPTGNSFKRTLFTHDIEDAPALDSTNLIIEGINLPDEEIIKGIKRGIYVDSVMGAHTGNIVAGEYSLNIGCGYLIENGQFTGKVMDAMVSGNIYEDFNKITAIGTKLESMRTIFYTIGYSPAVLFSELSVVGK
jgi:PmbA protein